MLHALLPPREWTSPAAERPSPCSLSLSLSIYIYIYICIFNIYIYIYIYIVHIVYISFVAYEDLHIISPTIISKITLTFKQYLARGVFNWRRGCFSSEQQKQCFSFELIGGESVITSPYGCWQRSAGLCRSRERGEL